MFEGLDRVDVLLQELPDSYASKAAAALRGLDLAFCYANPIPGGPRWPEEPQLGPALVLRPFSKPPACNAGL